MIKVELTVYEAELLNRPAVGSGGMQTLLKRLQRGLRGNTLTINDEDIIRIKKYCKNHANSGGFQQRLKPVLRAMDAAKYNTKLFGFEKQQQQQ